VLGFERLSRDAMQCEKLSFILLQCACADITWELAVIQEKNTCSGK